MTYSVIDPHRIFSLRQYAQHFRDTLDISSAAAAINGVGKDSLPFAVEAVQTLDVHFDMATDVDAIMAVTDAIPATGTVSLLLNFYLEDTLRGRQYCYFECPSHSRRMQVIDLPNMFLATFGDCLWSQVR